MTSLDLGTQVTTIGDNAFKNAGITGTLTIPTTVTEIGEVRQAPSLAPLSRASHRTHAVTLHITSRSAHAPRSWADGRPTRA